MSTPIEKLYSLRIGVQGENVATRIDIGMGAWMEEFPDATFHLLFKPYNDAFPVTPMLTSFQDGILTWMPTVNATSVVGVGYTEIRAIDANTGLIKKSRIVPTVVESSVTGMDTADPPPPYQEWVSGVLAAGAQAESAAHRAETAAGIALDNKGGLLLFTVDEMGDLIMTYSIGLPYTFGINAKGELIYHGTVA